ncbi:hypothetical protein M5K25_006762 [Dendrobium thyrsiflorum]|uniref:NB-ARC domain-containing protein n=1 Tax=Dendrobium thyrsiflorum TaxID=117978 RepID=A0ABD0VDM9_DENTH
MDMAAAVDEADDVLDEFQFMKHKEQLTKKHGGNRENNGVFQRELLIESASKIRKVGERSLKINSNLKRLKEVVQKLDKVSAGVSTFLHLLDSAKQEQQRELSEARETGSLPTNDLIGRGEAKEFAMQWLRKPSNEPRTTLYRNISLLSIVGHGDMLKSLKKKRPRLETLELLRSSSPAQVLSLSSHAFADVENPNDYKRLRSIAGKIVKKLSGSPLAAKVIGVVLKDNLVEMHWTNVLNSGLVSAELGQYVFPILRLRYMFLPKHLQNCFAFFSIFGQVYRCKTCNMDEECQSDLQSRDNRIGKLLGVGNSSTFWQLPFLKYLKLSYMPKVKWLESKFNGNDKSHAFPLLEELYICGLKALENWFEAGVTAGDGCLFPCLIELVLKNWPKLKELSSFPSKLKKLKIYNIGLTTLNFCSNSNPIPLETLEVCSCPNITSLPLAVGIARLAALRYLTIVYCPNLISLGTYREVENTNNCHLILSDLRLSDPSVLLMEPLRSIASLKKLIIRNNDELVSFPNEAEQWFLTVRSSLCELEFRWLKSLQSLPSSLESLSSLQKLSIHVVPMLTVSPSLNFLWISGCHPELHERYREDGGSYWQKIAHIPLICINPYSDKP